MNPKLFLTILKKEQTMNTQNTETPQIFVDKVQKYFNFKIGIDLAGSEENKKAKAVFLKLGNLYNGKVEVLSGLKAGDRVIVEGFAELDNGAPVTIK